MALVLPVVHDHFSSSDGSPANTWVFDSTANVGSSLLFLISRIETHNGQLVFSIDDDQDSRVYREQGSGWTTVGGEFKNTTAANSGTAGARDVFSWEGTLYAISQEGVETNVPSYRYQIAAWNEGSSSWSFETSASDGLQISGSPFYHASSNTPRAPRFFVYNNDLHVIYQEQNGTGNSAFYRVGISRRNGGSWTRVATSSALGWSQFSNLGRSSIAITGSNVWYLMGGQIWRFNGSTVTNMFSLRDQWLYHPSINYAHASDPSIHNIDGVPSVFYTRYRLQTGPDDYSNSNQYYHLFQSTDGGANWSSTQYSRPLAQNTTSEYNNTVFDYYDGKKYIVVYGKGPGVSGDTDVQVWAYRRDGSSWTQLGGGAAYDSPRVKRVGLNPILPITFKSGSIWVPFIGYEGPSSASQWFIKFDRTAR